MDEASRMKTDTATEDAPLFRVLRPGALVNHVASEIVEAIKTGRIRAGDRLNEVHIARQMNTSRGPLREALRLLESQGLIVSNPRKGFFVKRYTKHDLVDIYDLRLCLEVHSAQATVQRMSDADYDDLARQVDHLHELGARGEIHRQIVADYDFHLTISRIAGNRRILELMTSLSTELLSGITLIGHIYADPVRVAATHDPILAALRERDAALLGPVMEKHLIEARDAIIAMYEDSGLTGDGKTV